MTQPGGKVAVITGATAGIGVAIAKRFVAEGAYGFVTGRRQPALDAAVAEIGRNVTGVLVANAGGGGGSAQITDVTQERFDASAGLKFRGTYFTVQRALPLLNDGATIVLVSSIAAGNGTDLTYFREGSVAMLTTDRGRITITLSVWPGRRSAQAAPSALTRPKGA